ncbi:hypothetical protein BDR26DRAFT_930123 [Obelidium mucronatum]|nr:hypothetical protein BDR26DRAFT_930123 [Obelidium mucronatum]
MKAVALWPYAAVEDNELTFEAGDVLEVTDLCNEDWFEGELQGRKGYFPANRVQLLKDTDKQEQQEGQDELKLKEQGENDSTKYPVASTTQPFDETLETQTSGNSRQRSQEAAEGTASNRLSTSKRQAPEPPPSRRSIVMAASLESSTAAATAVKRSSLVSQTPPRDDDPTPQNPIIDANSLFQTTTTTTSNAPSSSTGGPTPPPVTPVSSPVPKDPFSDEISSSNDPVQQPMESPVDETSSQEAAISGDDEELLHNQEIASPQTRDESNGGQLEKSPLPTGNEESDALIHQQQVSDSLASLISQGGSKWKPMRDTDGQIYYWNESTNQTSWDPPATATMESHDDIHKSTPNIATNHYLSSPPSTMALLDDGAAVSATVSEGDINGLLATDHHHHVENAPIPSTSNPPASSNNNAPSPTPTPENNVSNAAPIDAAPDLDLSRFEQIPADLIIKDGTMKYKLSSTKETAGSATTTITTATTTASIKVTHPFDAILLTNATAEPVGKDQTSKKNAWMYTSQTGHKRLFLTDSEASTLQWVDSIKSAMRERHTNAEIDGVIARVFTKPRVAASSPGTVAISDPIPLVGSQLRMDAMGKAASGGVAGAGAVPMRRSLNVFSSSSNNTSASNSINGGKDRQSDGNVGKKFTFFGSSKKSAGKSALEAHAVFPHLPFGGFLDAQLEFEGNVRQIPRVVELCIQTVEARGGIEAQGIYRLSGNAATIGKLKVAFNHGENIDLSAEDDINVITGLLKSYFRELQNPLIPYDVYDQFIASSKVGDYNDRLIHLKNLIQALPPCNYTVLSYLLKHLKKIADKSDINKMEQSNLAIVFAPTLIRTPEGTGDAATIAQQGYASMANMPYHNKLIESMIEQYDWVFDGSKD